MEALALENNLIKRHRPRYNVLLRDDKNHPYLKLTLAEEYPRLYVVRRVGEDGNAYGGPYIPALLGRKTARMVHKLFGVRSCKEVLNGRRPRPCLQYQIGRCLAPCVAEISLPRALPPGLRRRAPVPGGTHGGGRPAVEGRDGAGGGGAPLRGGGQPARPDPRAGAAGHAAEDHDHRPRGARLLRGLRGGRPRRAPGLLRARREGRRARGVPARQAGRAGDRPVVFAAAVLRPGPVRAARDPGARLRCPTPSCCRPGSPSGGAAASCASACRSAARRCACSSS